jgi:hypothetical protein
MTPPVRFDRSALERVLARASELQSSETDGGEGLTEQQLLDLGREVGLDVATLRRAMAEEQSRAVATADRSVTTRVFGAARVSAERTVQGGADDVLAAIDQWMRRQEYLQLKRRYVSRMVWEPQRDLGATLARTFERAFGGREHAFARAVEVSAFVTPVDALTVHVRLDADLTPVRSGQLIGGGVVTGLSVTTGVILTVLGVAPLLAVAPMAIGPIAGFAVARGFRGRVSRAQLALEQLLDRLDSGELKRRGSLLDAIKSAALPSPPPRR